MDQVQNNVVVTWEDGQLGWSNASALLNGKVFHYHHWGDHFHLLPKDWVFPHGMKLQVFMSLWLVGQINDGIPPLRYLKNCLR